MATISGRSISVSHSVYSTTPVSRLAAPSSTFAIKSVALPPISGANVSIAPSAASYTSSAGALLPTQVAPVVAGASGFPINSPTIKNTTLRANNPLFGTKQGYSSGLSNANGIVSQSTQYSAVPTTPQSSKAGFAQILGLY